MAQWKGQQQEIVGGYGKQKTLELKKVSGLRTCTCLHFGVSLLNLQLFSC